MNQFRREQHARARLDSLGNAELERIEAGLGELMKQEMDSFQRETGRSFNDVLAHVIADRFSQNLLDETDLQSAVRLYPAVAMPLYVRFPEKWWLKRVAQIGVGYFEKKKRSEHYAEAVAARDVSLERWQLLHEKVKKGKATDVERAEELIAHIECHAGCHCLRDINPLRGYLREERINAVAKVLASMAMPRAGRADPWRLLPFDIK